MKFIADLHIHSKFSMATAKNLDFENLYIAAQLKGITVVATGDATHPGWISEIKEKLLPAEEGLFKLKDHIAAECDKEVPLSCRRNVRFILASEISSIYKKGNKTRKIHNLVFLPDLVTAESFNSRLDKIGNIKSDGRPILGLDARNLLEILLESSDKAFLIPAHIWTPWFSMFGSKSGFDSIEECFGDLAPHIFAAETGLSSDPAMNRRVSNLDNLTLVSNSDAHSPMKLGREANLFDTDLSYTAMKSALETGDPHKFLGTYEFFPEEGKYHMDGHRKCKIMFSPQETMAAGGICPVCQKPLTIGVMHRVEDLSDRDMDDPLTRSHPFYSLVPLGNILSDILQVGPNTKKVAGYYQKALNLLGNEFSIIYDLSIDNIKKANIPLLDEAIKKIRNNEIILIPGFDGEYGKIKIFDAQERKTLMGQNTFFSLLPVNKKKSEPKKLPKEKPVKKIDLKRGKNRYYKNDFHGDILDNLNEDQKNAVTHSGSPLLITAGPGTGKTRTLTHKIAYLVKTKGIPAERILALTFTVKASKEMGSRVKALTGHGDIPTCTTFHSFCLDLLQTENKGKRFFVIDDHDRKYFIKIAVKQVMGKGEKISTDFNTLCDNIVLAKQNLLLPGEIDGLFEKELEKKEIKGVYQKYQDLLSFQNLFDYEDLIFDAVNLLEKNNFSLKKYKKRFTQIFVDEYQDINQGQYRIIRALAPDGENLCAIGDPDQSIYAFRGSDVKFFNNFVKDYPKVCNIRLNRNYRSTQTILDASFQVLKNSGASPKDARIYSDIHGVKTIGIIETASEKAEAVAIGKYMEKLVGGTGFHSFDFNKVDTFAQTEDYSFSDFAVLFRTHRQGEIIHDILLSAGIPCQIAEKKRNYGKALVSGLLSFLKLTEDWGTYADFERVTALIDSRIGKKILEKFILWGIDNCFTIDEAIANINKISPKIIPVGKRAFIDLFGKKISETKKAINGMTIENRLKYIWDNLNIPDKMKNDSTDEALTALLSDSRNYSDNLHQFISDIALKTDSDTISPDVEKVSLMTIHAAKGLEFPVVFIAGCEKGLLPHERGKVSKLDEDEEKRLFFVAMTRAKERLYLTYAKKRLIFGKIKEQSLSPFVLAIEEDLKKAEKKIKMTTKKEKHVQLKLFE